MIATSLHLAVWVASACAAFAVYRRMHARAPVLATVFVAGVLIRLVFGLMLYAISAFRLPILHDMQAGDGFWLVAIDARSYFDLAASAARNGLGTITEALPSPVYLTALAAWMKIGGVSPLSAVLFNLMCYVGTAMCVLALSSNGAFAIVALSAVSFSPALIIFSTQVLKDSFVILLLAAAVAGVRIWCAAIRAGRPASSTAGFFLIAASTYALAGVRSYVAAIIVVALVASAVAALFEHGDGNFQRSRKAMMYAFLLVAVWLAFMSGAGSAYGYYRTLVVSLLTHPLTPVEHLDRVRAAFLDSGGATSIDDSELTTNERAETAGPAIGHTPPPAASKPPTISVRLGRLVRGYAAVFVPISVLRFFSIVHFSGGRGLLAITDLDTIAIDVALLLGAITLGINRRSRTWPLLFFIVVVAALTSTLLAYGVTNFGTLFRLRMMAVVPLWLLPLCFYNREVEVRDAP